MDQVVKILKPSEIIDSSSPDYISESQAWNAQNELHPKVVARPDSISSLSRLIAFLGDSDLDFTVRCQGVGSASARDVLISLSNFKEFEFDAENETITIGGGSSWGEVEAKLEEKAPGYQAVAARCSFVGVGGSILHGGLSWISSKYGLASDPHNFLDAQVVKLNGEVVWASKEPDLLFALRGGGHGFGIVTLFKLKVYQYPQRIYSGSINYSRSSLPAIARGAAEFASKMDGNPRTAMYLYNLDLMEGAFTGEESKPGLAIWVFDANGEDHGGEVFKWALDIEGAVDKTKVMSLREINKYGDAVEGAKGVCIEEFSNITVAENDMTEDVILRAWEWLDDIVAMAPGKLNVGTFVLVEFFQKPTFHSMDPSKDHAWPHTANQHLIQLGVGRPNDGTYPSPLDDRAFDALKNAGSFILGDKHSPADYFTNFVQEWNDHQAVYGENYARLMDAKKKYNPRAVERRDSQSPTKLFR